MRAGEKHRSDAKSQQSEGNVEFSLTHREQQVCRDRGKQHGRQGGVQCSPEEHKATQLIV